MKYLRNYMEAKQTQAFKKAGAFFAFSQKQLEEGKKENDIKKGTKLIQMGGGMICPVDNSVTLKLELTQIYKESIKEDIAENGINAIIKRELNNHECYYTGNIEDCMDALSGYNITKENILSIFNVERQSEEVLASL